MDGKDADQGSSLPSPDIKKDKTAKQQKKQEKSTTHKG